MENENNKPREIELDAPEVEAKIRIVIDEFLTERSEAEKKAAANRTRLRRTAFERVEERGLMEPAPMYAEYIKIEGRTSNLPSDERRLITSIVLDAMRRAFGEKIKALQAAQNDENENK